MKIYLIISNYIVPVIEEPGPKSFLSMYLKIALPLGISLIMSQFVAFDCICNLYAEVTAFADRKFYDDFWNSCTVDEYFKKCNVLLPSFLRKYVYVALLKKQVPKIVAKFITVLLSSLFLEMIMVLLFFTQIFQQHYLCISYLYSEFPDSILA